jgi:hypothetical protein
MAGVRAAGDVAEAAAVADTAVLLERLERLPSSRELDRERKRLETAGKTTAARRRRRAESDMMRAVISTVQLVLRDSLCVQAGAVERPVSNVDISALQAIADSVPRARLERGIAAVDAVRIALGQPINVPLAMAAVFARVRQTREAAAA